MFRVIRVLAVFFDFGVVWRWCPTLISWDSTSADGIIAR